MKERLTTSGGLALDLIRSQITKRKDYQVALPVVLVVVMVALTGITITL